MKWCAVKHDDMEEALVGFFRDKSMEVFKTTYNAATRLRKIDEYERKLTTCGSMSIMIETSTLLVPLAPRRGLLGRFFLKVSK